MDDFAFQGNKAWANQTIAIPRWFIDLALADKIEELGSSDSIRILDKSGVWQIKAPGDLIKREDFT